MIFSMPCHGKYNTVCIIARSWQIDVDDASARRWLPANKRQTDSACSWRHRLYGQINYYYPSQPIHTLPCSSRQGIPSSSYIFSAHRGHARMSRHVGAYQSWSRLCYCCTDGFKDTPSSLIAPSTSRESRNLASAHRFSCRRYAQGLPIASQSTDDQETLPSTERASKSSTRSRTECHQCQLPLLPELPRPCPGP